MPGKGANCCAGLAGCTKVLLTRWVKACFGFSFLAIACLGGVAIGYWVVKESTEAIFCPEEVLSDIFHREHDHAGETDPEIGRPPPPSLACTRAAPAGAGPTPEPAAGPRREPVLRPLLSRLGALLRVHTGVHVRWRLLKVQ